MLAIALVSFASLLLELGLTRLFSVVLFYHFAFLAISVALLGLGAGGVFAYVRKPWLEQFASRTLGQRLCAANAVVTLLVLEIVLHLPISLELTRGNFAKLTVLYLASAVPFFFTGLLFSVVFARESEAHTGPTWFGRAVRALVRRAAVASAPTDTTVVFGPKTMALGTATSGTLKVSRNAATTCSPSPLRIRP